MEKAKLKKIYIAVGIAILLLAIGFYLYYFYPQVIPGLASTSLKQDVYVLIVGLDDRESVVEGEISADAIVLAQLYVDNKELKISNIILEEKPSFGESIDAEKLTAFLADIGKLASVELNYYFTISYQGFIDLVDKLGGITITREEELNVPDLNLALKQGNNNLSGEEALNYARFYDYTKDEQDRAKRQQEIISAIIDKALQETTLVNIPQMFNTAISTYNSIETNLEYTLVVDLIEFLIKNREISINYGVIAE
ncbi:MAG: LCP family protein [Halanaerobiaceae bacterium]|nr:LCP family protein [Halanaerobiaceae bacterium]